MGTMAATAHTYYLARWDRCLGDQAHNAELCALLKREWLSRARDIDEPSIADGFSAWLDKKGAVHACLVRMATAQMLEDANLERELGAYLNSYAPTAPSEGERGAPEHPLP